VVNLATLLYEFDRLLLHTLLKRIVVGHAVLLGVIANVLGNLHRTKMRPAHRAEMRHLGTVLRQCLVVEVFRRIGVESKVELIFPAEFEPGF